MYHQIQDGMTESNKIITKTSDLCEIATGMCIF